MDNPYIIHKLDTPITLDGLVNVSYYTLGKDFLWEGESHDFWEMVYVDHGELVVTAGTDTYRLKSGEAAFHRPNEFHNLRAAERKPAGVIVVSFLCSSLSMASFEKKILSLSAREKDCLTSLVEEAEAAFLHFDNIPPRVDLVLREEPPFGATQIVKNLLEYFLILILRHTDDLPFDARAVPVSQLHHHSQLAVQVIEYLQKSFSQQLSLDQIARQHNVSISLLKRVFRQYTGQSVVTYLTDVRIRAAKALIREGQMNFSQIALMVGYDNIYYFSTVFKRTTGITPTEYSKSLRK